MSLDGPGLGLGDGGLDPGSPVIQDTYVVDPIYARHFTEGWAGMVALFVLLYSPSLLRSIRTGRIWQGLAFWEDSSGYRAVATSPKAVARRNDPRPPSLLAKPIGVLRSLVHGPSLLSIPRSQLDLGQIAIICSYYGILLTCLMVQSELRTNSNRAGFLALAQLPAVFLFGVKNSPIHFLLGRGYEKLNLLHRWSGRGIWLMATVHGSLWINQYISQGQSDFLKTEKPRLGMAAYGCLCMMVILSLRPVRQRFYQLFFITHIFTFVGFFVIICYHTPYSVPWIYAPIALYAFDLFTRLFRYRFKDAVLESHDTQMTLVHVPYVTSGWVAGQHVNLRVFFSGKDGAKVWESHSFTIANAPAERSALTGIGSGGAKIISSSSSTSAEIDEKRSTVGSSSTEVDVHPGGMTLGVRAVGNWTQALNALAQSSPNPSAKEGTAHVSVLIDGPYGGSSLDFGNYERVLLVAGGSGATFTLGVLDDLVGRVVKLGRPNGERTRKIMFVWYVRSFGALYWFERMFKAIGKTVEAASLMDGGKPTVTLEFKFFVTCLCDPEGVPQIPNSSVEIGKPLIGDLLKTLVFDDEDDVEEGSRLGGGGVGVAASGPESLIRGAQNAVARVGPVVAARVGGIELHTELFSL